MDKASEVILAVRPVTFHYTKELDPESIQHFGLVVEDVDRVNPDLAVRDAEGKPYTVRYEAVNAMLLNEFLKEHWTVQGQEATIAQLMANAAKQDARATKQDAAIARQEEQIEALTRAYKKSAHKSR
jgi:trimeric autotransporter adhesin